ncbi:MAG: hypothetical protein SFZ03_06085 [Candidatus Melainabacteria bacterium]|nr:hypothetical protein [Candidatus Melainabacteria bacterium]
MLNSVLSSTKKSTCGSVIVLVLALLFLITFEMLIMGLVVSRSLGEEGILVSQNLGAREATQVATTRLIDRLNTYVLANGAGSAADTAFASGGAQAISNQVLQTRNPEAAGSAEQNTDITISAWVSSRRGNYFLVNARAVTGGVTLTAQRWVFVNPCNPNGGLQTIVSGQPYPGYDSMAVDTQRDRVFFGVGNHDTTGNFYTWNSSTGLSTILSNRRGVGYQAVLVDETTGRAFFGDNDRMYTWTEGAGLQTIMSNAGSDPGNLKMFYDSTRAQLFFLGDQHAYRWDSTSGLTTLASNIFELYGKKATYSSATGNLYFMSRDGNIHRWAPASGFTTLFNTGGVWTASISLDPLNERIFVSAENGSFYVTWNPATGLSTILSQTAIVGWNPGIGEPANFNTPNIGASWGYANDGRIFFHDARLDNSRFYTWHPSTGLTQIAFQAGWGLGYGSTAVDRATGRVFFGSYGGCASSGTFHTWQVSTGLSTLTSNGCHPGTWGTTLDQSTGRVFYSNHFGGRAYTWLGSTGLSTLAGNGQGGSIAYDPYEQIVYWQEDPNILSWTLGGTGAQTIVTASPTAGIGNSMIVNPGVGVYFGQDNNPGNFYAYRYGNCKARQY